MKDFTGKDASLPVQDGPSTHCTATATTNNAPSAIHPGNVNCAGETYQQLKRQECVFICSANETNGDLTTANISISPRNARVVSSRAVCITVTFESIFQASPLLFFAFRSSTHK